MTEFTGKHRALAKYSIQMPKNLCGLFVFALNGSPLLSRRGQVNRVQEGGAYAWMRDFLVAQHAVS
ncbi:MAG: hypothetical protein K0R24_1689 [Gammaproteobacteria bacterium]|nr:hypothetical protein [Gammaproteobacteria bacterium]